MSPVIYDVVNLLAAGDPFNPRPTSAIYFHLRSTFKQRELFTQCRCSDSGNLIGTLIAKKRTEISNIQEYSSLFIVHVIWSIYLDKIFLFITVINVYVELCTNSY